MNNTFHALFGLKWNPFSNNVPTQGLYITPQMTAFFERIEKTHTYDGGFSLIMGEPGCGKSCSLRLIVDRLTHLTDLTIGVFSHPQSGISDFYRELGDLFEVPLKPNNRWHSFSSLREQWRHYLMHSNLKPLLIIDEAQEMSIDVMNELRLLNSDQFDSNHLLSVIFAANSSFQDKLRATPLLPLSSRIRKRLIIEHAPPEQLIKCLHHLITSAGNANLMTKELMQTLCDQSIGNYRVMTSLANELLEEAVIKNKNVIDERLYFELFNK